MAFYNIQYSFSRGFFRTFAPYLKGTDNGRKGHSFTDNRVAQRLYPDIVRRSQEGGGIPQHAHQGADGPGRMAEPPALRAQVGKARYHRPCPVEPLCRYTVRTDARGQRVSRRGRGENHEDQGGAPPGEEEPYHDGGPAGTGTSDTHARQSRQESL